MEKTIMPKYLFSLDEEKYHWAYEGASFDNAKKGALEHIWDETLGLEPIGRKYWIGEEVNPIETFLSPYYVGEICFEAIRDSLADDCYNGDDYCLDILEAKIEPLGELIINFLRENADVVYCGIANVQEFVVSAQDLADFEATQKAD